jgi:PadR family transcriptional regulator AphA
VYANVSIKHAILALLEIDQGSGYDLVTRFNNSIGSFWSATHQQVYKELAALAEAGWVEFEEVGQAGKPDKKIYRLTSAGVEELKRWLHLPVKPLKVKYPFLIKIFAGDHLPPADLLQAIVENEQEHREALNAYLSLERWIKRLPDDELRKYRLPYATMKLGMKVECAWLEWSEEMKRELAP